MRGLRDGREANDAKLSQTADNPGPDRAGSLEAVRHARENELNVMRATHVGQSGFSVMALRSVMTCMDVCCEVPSTCTYIRMTSGNVLPACCMRCMRNRIL